MQEILAERHEPPADQVGGEEAQQGQQAERDDQSKAGDVHRDVSLGAKGVGDQRPRQIIDPIDKPPRQADSDVDRTDKNEAGQKIIPDAAAKTVMHRCRRGRIGRLRRRIALARIHCRLGYSTVTDFARLRG